MSYFYEQLFLYMLYIKLVLHDWGLKEIEIKTIKHITLWFPSHVPESL